MAKTIDDIGKSIRNLGVWMEEMVDQNQLFTGVLSDVQQKVSKLPTRDEFQELQLDVKTIKLAVTDTSKQVQQHESILQTFRSKTA